MRRMPVKKYLEEHTGMLSRLGKGPGAEPPKKGGGQRGKEGEEAKRAPIPSARMKSAKKKTAKKRAGAKRG